MSWNDIWMMLGTILLTFLGIVVVFFLCVEYQHKKETRSLRRFRQALRDARNKRYIGKRAEVEG